MHLWISKNSEVPIREQITTQIVLAIVSNDVKPGQKLPSTRELARRFRIHANTVSAAYRDLAARKWVEFRKGSGIYVRELAVAQPVIDKKLQLDRIISTFLGMARQQGFSLAEIRKSVKEWLEYQPPRQFLVIESDPEFRRILTAEIEDVTGFPTAGAGLEACRDEKTLAESAPVAMYGQAEEINKLLPPDVSCIFLHSRSIHSALPILEMRSPETLVEVVSSWPEFLKWANTMLVAAGVDPLALNLRDAREPDWSQGLGTTGVVLTETLTAKLLPKGCRVVVYNVLAEASVIELREFVGQFLT